MSDIYLACPYHARAVYEFEAFFEAFKPIIKSVNKNQRKITLQNGSKIYFLNSKRQQMHGIGANVMDIDDFRKLIKKWWEESRE